MYTTQQLCEQYGLTEEDDWQALEHVQYLLDIKSLAFNEGELNLDALDGIENQLEYIFECCLTAYYTDAVCKLVESTMVFFLRLKYLVTNIVDAEIEIATNV